MDVLLAICGKHLITSPHGPWEFPVFKKRTMTDWNGNECASVHCADLSILYNLKTIYK